MVYRSSSDEVLVDAGVVPLDPAVLDLQSFVDGYFQGRSRLRVLEAGCGSSSYLTLLPETHLVGIDISEQQLSRNELLSEKILGDLQTHDLPAASFDMVVCWDVLEHLPHPEWAVERLLKAVQTGGIVVLAMPNVLSLKGQITKWTPHGFHVWVYRHVFGRRLSGTADHGPFKTFLKLSIAPVALRRFALQRGFSVAFYRLYESNVQRSVRAKVGLVNRRWRFLQGLTRFLSLGRIDATNTDFILVLRQVAATTS